MTAKAAANGAMALGLTRVVTNIGNLVALVVLARLLTPKDFGLVAICTTALGIVVALTEASVGSALIQRTETTRAHLDSAWTMALLRAAAITAGFAIAAQPLAALYGDARLVPLFIVSGATGALTSITNPKIALQTKKLSFRPLIAMQVCQKLSGLVISIGLALWLGNYWAIIAGTAIGTALSVFLSYALVPYRPRFTLARSSELLGFSSWLYLGQLANVLNWRFDQLLIGLFLPPAQLGAYAMADNISAIPSRETTTPIVQVLFPSFARLQDQADRLRAAYLTAQTAIGVVALPTGLGLALLAEPIVQMALGAKWMLAVPLIQGIACSYAVQTLVTGARPLAMALGQTRSLFLRDIVGLLLRVPFVVGGLAGWGLTGLVWGRVLSSTLGVFIAFAMVRALLNVPIVEQVWAHRRTALAVVAMAAAVLLSDRMLIEHGAGPLLRIGLLVPTGGLVYICVLGTLWLASGRRPGAESELIGLARGAVARFSS